MVLQGQGGSVAVQGVKPQIRGAVLLVAVGEVLERRALVPRDVVGAPGPHGVCPRVLVPGRGRLPRRRRCRLIRRLEERGGRCAVTGRVRDRARVRRFQLDAGGEPATAGYMQPACGDVKSVRNVYLEDAGLNARMCAKQ